MTTDHVKDFISNFPDYLSHIYFMFMCSFSYLVYTRANFYRLRLHINIAKMFPFWAQISMKMQRFENGI